MTGMGRTGKNFAIEHWNIAPDILIVAKGLSSGYAPLGAVIATEKVVDGIASGAFLHGFTYNAHPVSMAAGRAVLRRLQAQNLVQAADSGHDGTIAAGLERSLSTLLDLKTVGDVRGIGLLRGVEFVSEKPSKKPFAPELNFAGRVTTAALQARPAGLSHSRMRRRRFRRPPADRTPGGHYRGADRLVGPAAERIHRRSSRQVARVRPRRSGSNSGSQEPPILHVINHLGVYLRLIHGLPAVHCLVPMSRPNWLSGRKKEMASPMIDFCEQANPNVLTEVRRVKRFENASRIHNGADGNPEKRVLIWLAERTPRWISSDHLTLLGFGAQVMAGVSYALPAGTGTGSWRASSFWRSTGWETASTARWPGCASSSVRVTGSTWTTSSTASAGWPSWAGWRFRDTCIPTSRSDC